MSEPSPTATFITAGVIAALGVALVALSAPFMGADTEAQDTGPAYDCRVDIVIAEDGSNLCVENPPPVVESREQRVVDELLQNRDENGDPGTYPWFRD